MKLNKLLLLVLTPIFLFCCAKQNDTILSSQKQFQIPVLKGKSNNPILQIKMVGGSEEQLPSVVVSLEGTSDLNDIKSVQLFSMGQDSVWDSSKEYKQVGENKISSAKLTFSEDLPLDKKENNFYVTCKLADNANLHHKISARCDKIVLDDDSYVIPQSNSILLEQRIGVAVRQHMDENVDTYRIPGFATTNKGTLLAIYDARRNSSRDLQGDIDIGLSRSSDGGNTWEPMQLVLDMGEWGGLPQKFNGISDACVLVDENSDNIFIAGLWMHGVLNEKGKWTTGLTKDSDNWEHQWKRKGSQPEFSIKQTCQFMLTQSTDDGKTWSEPVNLTKQIKRKEWWLLAPAPGRGITLEDGTLLMPTEGRDENGTPFSNIIFSKDDGKTWQTSNPAASKANENQAVQLSDGSIMLNMRSDIKGRIVAVTSDLGQTWREHPTSQKVLNESGCMASLHRHNYTENGVKKHILLFSNPNTTQGRHHTTIKVSFDDGLTWPEKYWLLLDEGKNRGYSCLTSIDENTIGILYESSQADMTFESIPLNELIGEN